MLNFRLANAPMALTVALQKSRLPRKPKRSLVGIHRQRRQETRRRRRRRRRRRKAAGNLLMIRKMQLGLSPQSLPARRRAVVQPCVYSKQWCAPRPWVRLPRILACLVYNCWTTRPSRTRRLTASFGLSLHRREVCARVSGELCSEAQ